MPKSVARSNAMVSCKRVAILAGYPHQIALNGGLHLLLTILDDAHDFASLLDGDPLLQGDLLAHAGTGRRHDRAIGQGLQRHMAFDHLLLENVQHRAELEFILALQGDLLILLVQLDRGMRILQVVALLEFFDASAARRSILPAARSCRRRRMCYQALMT